MGSARPPGSWSGWSTRGGRAAPAPTSKTPSWRWKARVWSGATSSCTCASGTGAATATPRDPNYNGVVLHAALEVESDSTGLHSGGNVPVVSLASLLDEADHPDQDPDHETGAGEDDQAGVSGNLWNLLEPLGYPCPATKAQAGELLDRAGDQRFQVRVREFAVLLEETGLAGDSSNQLLYEGLMEGLGYKANRAGVPEPGEPDAMAAAGRTDRRHERGTGISGGARLDGSGLRPESQVRGPPLLVKSCPRGSVRPWGPATGGSPG